MVGSIFVLAVLLQSPTGQGRRVQQTTRELGHNGKKNGKSGEESPAAAPAAEKLCCWTYNEQNKQYQYYPKQGATDCVAPSHRRVPLEYRASHALTDATGP